MKMRNNKMKKKMSKPLNSLVKVTEMHLLHLPVSLNVTIMRYKSGVKTDSRWETIFRVTAHHWNIPYQNKLISVNLKNLSEVLLPKTNWNISHA